MKQIAHLMTSRFIIWAGIIALLLGIAIYQTLYLLDWPSKDVLIGLLDPDVYIRLTKVRDLLQDGNVYNHTVAATNAPYGGIDTPWTRPLDFILIALYQFTPPDLSIEKRLLMVGSWYPMIMIGLIIFFASKAVETGSKSLIKFSTLILCIAGYAAITPTYEYFMPGNVDHHSLQALLWCVCVWLLIDKPTRRNAVWLGAAMGLWTWVSPESIFYVFAILVIQAFMAVKKTTYTIFPLISCLSLTVVTLLGIFVEIPANQILTAQYYDTLSIVYVTLFSLCTAGFFIMYHWISKIPDEKYRLNVSIGAAVVLGLSFIMVFPKFLKGPMADVEPYIITNFLTRIWEATPILSTGASIYLPNLYLPVLAILLSARFFNKAPILLPLLLIAFDINLLQLRGFYYLEILSMIIIAKLLPTYLYAIRRKYNIRPLLLNPLSALLAVHLVMAAVLQMIPTSKIMSDSTVTDCNSLAFQTIQNGDLVKVMGNSPLIMESNILGNSGISFFTPYHYIAGFYHREGVGMEIKDKIMESQNLESVRPLLKDRQVKFLFICPSPVKDAWVNQYFNATPYPELDWVTVNTSLALPSKHRQTTKPLLLMIDP